MMGDVAIEKAEEGPYWERLLQDKTKAHWLKIDFSRWKDEDESDEENGDEAGGMPGMGGMGGMEQMMAQMGGMGGMGGMPGMGGMGGGMDMAEMMKGMKMPAGGEDDGEGDSDDEELPDLE